MSHPNMHSSALDEIPSIIVLLLLAGIEARHGSVITHNAGINLAAGAIRVGKRNIVSFGHRSVPIV